jgi:hypothetical protein
MHKLKLDLDQLTVDSFDTLSADGAGRGTIEAFQTNAPPCTIVWNPTYAPTCADTCATCPVTCYNSCGGTCDTCYCSGHTCGGSCYDPTCATCQTNCEQESCGVYICP